MRILIGVDDSAYSHEIVGWLKRNNWPKDAQVTVLSVAPRAMVAYASPEYPASAYSADVFEEQMKLHQDIAQTYEGQLRELGLRTDARVLEGDPREAIVTTAREIGADLVVVGSHGRTGLGRLVMGSVASHVVTHAPCSVLVVKLKGAAARVGGGVPIL